MHLCSLARPFGYLGTKIRGVYEIRTVPYEPAHILFVFVFSVNAGVERCPSHLQRTRNLIQQLSSCYEYHIDEEKKWEDARDNCKANQGHLVVINSASEQAKVFNGLQVSGCLCLFIRLDNFV